MSVIVDLEAIGNLVKSWVLGEDRLNVIPGKTWPKPESTTTKTGIDALRKQFKDAGTNFTIPETVTEVKVVQESATCFVLKLPDPDLIKKQEGRLETTPYPMPSFYLPACNNPPNSIGEKLRLDARRIGDYTIANCAGGP